MHLEKDGYLISAKNAAAITLAMITATTLLAQSCGPDAGHVATLVTIKLGQLDGKLEGLEFYVYAGIDKSGNTINCSTFLDQQGPQPDDPRLDVLLFRVTSYYDDRDNFLEWELPVGSDLVVYVIGYEYFSRDSRLMLGHGCQDSVVIKEGETTEVTITLAQKSPSD